MDIYTGMGQVDWDWMQMIWKKMRMDTCQLVRQAAQDRTGSGGTGLAVLLTTRSINMLCFPR